MDQSVLKLISGRPREESGSPGSLTGFAPFGPVLDDPIGQGAFEPDIPSNLFRFNPFVLQDLFAFGLKLTVERRILQQIGGEWLFRLVRHNTMSMRWKYYAAIYSLTILNFLNLLTTAFSRRPFSNPCSLCRLNLKETKDFANEQRDCQVRKDAVGEPRKSL